MREKILFITKHNPFGTGGGSIATSKYISLMADIFDLDLIMAEECYNKEKADTINIKNVFLIPQRSCFRKILETPLGIFHRFGFIYKKVIFSNYKYIFLDHSAISSSFVKYCKRMNIKTITLHHNFEKEYFLADSRNKYKNLLVYFVQKNEKKAYIGSDINLFLTSSDMDKFKSCYGNRDGCYITSLFFGKNSSIHKRKKNDFVYDMIISCSLNDLQNENSIISFLSNYKSKTLNKCKILICGRNPSAKLCDFLMNYNNVTLVQNPVDMDELLLLSKIYLCIIENGGGIKVRCFDALKYCMPCIIHENSVRGYEDLVSADFFHSYNINSFDRVVMDVMNFNFSNDFLDKYKSEITKHYSFCSAKEKMISIINSMR